MFVIHVVALTIHREITFPLVNSCVVVVVIVVYPNGFGGIDFFYFVECPVEANGLCMCLLYSYASSYTTSVAKFRGEGFGTTHAFAGRGDLMMMIGTDGLSNRFFSRSPHARGVGGFVDTLLMVWWSERRSLIAFTLLVVRECCLQSNL